jgi:hypothetical protein
MATKKVSGKSKKFSKSSNKKKTMKRGKNVGGGGKRRSMRGGSGRRGLSAARLERNQQSTAMSQARIKQLTEEIAAYEAKQPKQQISWKDVWKQPEPNYVKPTHYYPPVNPVNPNKIAASSSPASQPNKFKKRTGKNPGRKGRGYF